MKSPKWSDDIQPGRCGKGFLADRYEARASVGLVVSGFVALIGSAGGVSLNPGKADLGTSTAHPAMLADHAAKTTKAVIERALEVIARHTSSLEASLAPPTFFNG
jgi:hypothetical protein